jgi:thymidylate synthase (FAD)
MESPSAIVTLLAYTHYRYDHANPEALAEFAGRVCTRSTERMGQDNGFIKTRIAQRHDSILEHCSASWLLEQVSRALTHQLVRHRIASYSQESQRHVRVGDRDGIVIPPQIDANKKAQQAYLDSVGGAVSAYHRMINEGARPEDARFVLPQGIETRIVLTMNFRQLRHFFQERCAPSAQWEIRHVAKIMLEHIHEIAPQCFDDLYHKFLLEEAE